jgi:formiminotetrahydrofolate cyclodeaminase
MRTAAPSASSRVLDKTLASFLEAVAARTSAPGGGTVAAVATAIAAALVEMAAQFSSKHWDDADAAAVRARELRERAAPLAQADAEAYEAVIAARGEPGYDEALSRAADVPLAIVEAAADVAELAAELAAQGNPNLRGDAVTAALLAEASARAAANLVEINLAERDRDRRVDRAQELASAAGAAARRALTPPS